LRAKLDTVINSLSANHAYLITLYRRCRIRADGHFLLELDIC